MLIQPATHVLAVGADTCAVGDIASYSRPDAMQWESADAVYSDVFRPPGMPADHDTIHHMELKPGSVPPLRW